MSVIQTGNLILEKLTVDDAPFIFELVNDPSWLRFIGDKGVANLEDARDYIQQGPVASYARFGFGMYVARRKADSKPAGICGLVKRDSLDAPDLGLAFLPEYRGYGYGIESARAVMKYGKTVLGLERIIAITAPDNERTIRLLQKLGMRFEEKVRFSEDLPENLLYV